MNCKLVELIIKLRRQQGYFLLTEQSREGQRERERERSREHHVRGRHFDKQRCQRTRREGGDEQREWKPLHNDVRPYPIIPPLITLHWYNADEALELNALWMVSIMLLGNRDATVGLMHDKCMT